VKRYGGLFERIVAFDNLLLAANRALKGKKQKRGAAAFYFGLENELLAIEKELLDGRYSPMPCRDFHVYEPKRRKICAAEFRDRVVHHAICNVLEPILDRGLIFDTYACRRGKGSHAAVRRTQEFSRRFAYFLKCDIRGYFENVDHRVLKALLSRRIKDRRLLDLLSVIIDHPVPQGRPGKGIPIGNLTSQLFANIYLGELDHFLKERLATKGYVRYMDDFLVFGPDKRVLRECLTAIRKFVNGRLLLDLKDEALIVAPVWQGIPFLGFRVFPGTVRLDKRRLKRFRRKTRQRERQYRQGQIDEDFLVNSVRSMVAHVSHANTYVMRKGFFLNSLNLG